LTQTASEQGPSYTVSTRDESRTVQGREAAMEVAKNLSQERRGGVEVESQDGRIRIRFSSGQIESYTFDMPGSRPRRS
jgi:hypothetical protein